MPISSFPQFVQDNYEIHEWRHASAILEQDFPSEFEDLSDILGRFRLNKSFIDVGGGNKTKLSGWIDKEFNKKGWVEKKFDTKISVDAVDLESPTHAVDCFKNRIALELEWNNKDPFYDRDLNNFRLLFDLRVISVGIIITRSDELKEIFTSLGRYSSYGESTTHMGKLLPRIRGGGGAGCPILAFGITNKLYDPDA